MRAAPIRVLYVSPGTDTHGGAERSLLGLIDGLDRADVEPSAVVLGEGSMVDALRARGIATTALDLEFRGGASYGSFAGRVAASWPAGRSLVRAAAVVKGVMEREGTQVVHSNGMRGHVLLPLLRRRGVATVASIRDLPRSRFESVVLMAALRSADGVIATSEYVKRQLRFARNVRVIDNPVCAPELPDAVSARQALGLPADAFVVAMLAHFHRWKGHLDLVRAVEPLDDAWVLLAGGDLYGGSSTECRDEVLSFARSRGFAHRVRCVGAVDDVGPVYAAADVIAHCSIRPEPFGRTVAEAMLAGRPVVASSAGAPGEFVSRGETGLLFAPGRSVELREHLVSLRESPEMRTSLARAARDRVVDRFEPHRHSGRVLAVYEEASGSRSAQEPRLHRWSPIGSEVSPSVEGRFARLVVSRLGLLNVGQRARAQALCRAVAGLPAPRSILDVGCGRGVNSILLAKWFPQAQVVGVDIDAAALETARRCASGVRNVEFEEVSSEHIGQAERAELVVCVDVLEHVADDERLAAELLDRVAGGGSLVVHVPLRDQHYAFPTVRDSMLRAIAEGRDAHVREGYAEADLRRLFGEEFDRFETTTTLAGVTSVVADLEALSALKQSPLPRILGLPLLPCAGSAGGHWSKGILAIGRGRRQPWPAFARTH